MKFKKGLDHRLTIDGEDVICKEGMEIPKQFEDWFKKCKPSWIEGSKGARKSPADKMAELDDAKTKGIEPLSTDKKKK